MRVNNITPNYSNNINNTNKLYASKPVFKQSQTDSIVPTAIMETLVEAANDKKNQNAFMSKIHFFRDVLSLLKQQEKHRNSKTLLNLLKT